MKKLFFLFVLVFSSWFLSCGNIALGIKQKTICVQLPDFYSCFYENCPVFVGWKILVCSEFGLDEFFTTETSFCVAGDKNVTGCVLGYPVCMDVYGNEVLFFEPAGALFLNADDNACLVLDWSKGFSAYAMFCLFESEYASGVEYHDSAAGIGEFNWLKMEEQIEERIFDRDTGVFYNPWKIDLESLLKAIAFRNFKVGLLSLNNVLEVTSLETMEIWSSYVPENKNIKKNHKILIKQSEVNLISDYNLNAIIIVGKSADRLSIKKCTMPDAMIGYD